ncbi:MAG: DNA alkylation repair protein [Clostridia bacterium]|nr:DNA alkylation repair protein [Clostridia bacterium]
MNAREYIQGRLMSLRDEEYGKFQIKLVPNIAADTVIGVRTPDIRKLAKEIYSTPFAGEFMSDVPHRYFDENNLHGLMIERIGEFDAAAAALDAFLPFIDNWATCDIISARKLAKSPDRLLEKISEWIASDHTYTIRFGLKTLMAFYLDGRFKEEYLEWAAAIRSNEYYVNMMIAWFFATALAKQYDSAVRYIEQKRLDAWTHNKAIQKAVESYRIPDERKAFLRAMKLRI